MSFFQKRTTWANNSGNIPWRVKTELQTESVTPVD